MPISHPQLAPFVRLSEVANFTRSAEEFGITPPAVTLQIRALSEHFGVALVDIVKRRPILARAGRSLAERSRDVIAGVATLELKPEQFTSGATQPLVLGATVAVGRRDRVVAGGGSPPAARAAARRRHSRPRSAPSMRDRHPARRRHFGQHASVHRVPRRISGLRRGILRAVQKHQGLFSFCKVNLLSDTTLPLRCHARPLPCGPGRCARR